jgi:ABC-2 type transport system permease protein
MTGRTSTTSAPRSRGGGARAAQQGGTGTGSGTAAPGFTRSPGQSVAPVPALALIAAVAARPGLPASTWAAVILGCWLGSLPFAAIGIFIGLVASSSAAQPIMIATTLMLNVLGGLLVPLQAFPPWLRDVARVLPTYRLGDLGWNTVAHRPFDPVDVAVLAAYAAVFAALAAWRYRADDRRPIG